MPKYLLCWVISPAAALFMGNATASRKQTAFCCSLIGDFAVLIDSKQNALIDTLQ